MKDALVEPKPVQPRLPIMIGGSGPKKTLRTLARYGDQWNTSGTLDELRAKDAILRERCAEIGRDPDTIERTVTIDLVIRDSRAAALEAYKAILAGSGGEFDESWAGPIGTPDEIADAIRPMNELGFRHILIDTPSPYDPETLDRIGEVHRAPQRMTRVVTLAGGVGGAKLADGLQAHIGDALTVVVNTGDDCWRHGLLVMPDHDTVLYNLAGIEQVEWGWGIEGDTRVVMDQLGVYGEETWFTLGDRDLALHIARTARVRAGARVTDACLDAQAALGIAARILPMADEPVATEVRTADGWLEFQEYFVHQRQAPDVLELRFAGLDGRGTDARGDRGVRDGRGDRHRAVEPARLGRADPRRAGDARPHRGSAGAGRARRRRSPRSSAARRSRARRTGCSSPPATRRAPSGSRACTPGSSTCSCSTRWMRTRPRRSRRSGSAPWSPTRS